MRTRYWERNITKNLSVGVEVQWLALDRVWADLVLLGVSWDFCGDSRTVMFIVLGFNVNVCHYTGALGEE